MAKSIAARLLALEAFAERRRAVRLQPSRKEWEQAAQSDDLSYAGWMQAHGYSGKMIAIILDRRRRAEETLRLFDDPDTTHT